jgi:hypothetical protein
MLGGEVEAFVPKRHTEKQDGSTIVEGEELDFRVLAFAISSL